MWSALTQGPATTPRPLSRPAVVEEEPAAWEAAALCSHGLHAALRDAPFHWASRVFSSDLLTGAPTAAEAQKWEVVRAARRRLPARPASFLAPASGSTYFPAALSPRDCVTGWGRRVLTYSPQSGLCPCTPSLEGTKRTRLPHPLRKEVSIGESSASVCPAEQQPRGVGTATGPCWPQPPCPLGPASWQSSFIWIGTLKDRSLAGALLPSPGAVCGLGPHPPIRVRGASIQEVPTRLCEAPGSQAVLSRPPRPRCCPRSHSMFGL